MATPSLFLLMHVFVLLKSGLKEASDIPRRLNESLYWLLFELVFIWAIPQNKVTEIVGLNHPQCASLTHCLLFMRYMMENELLNIPTVTPQQRDRVPPYLQSSVSLLCYPARSVICLAALL